MNLVERLGKKKIDGVELGNVETMETELEGLQHKKHGLVVGRIESKRKTSGVYRRILLCHE